MTIDDALPQGEVSDASRAPRNVPIIRVLAIDGGGLRGMIPLRVLMELERLTGRGAATLFDVVAGTSTGGVVALALCRPDADGKPAMSAARILEIYCEWAPKIFVKPKLRSALPLIRQKSSRAAVRQRVGALVTPRRYGNARYSAEGIGNLYKDCLGDARLVDALTDVIVPAYDWKAGRAVVFRSRTAKKGGLNPTMVEVARATSAAPTYFPPMRIAGEDGRELICIDGGVAANNPATVAYYEALVEERELGRRLRLPHRVPGHGPPAGGDPHLRGAVEQGLAVAGDGHAERRVRRDQRDRRRADAGDHVGQGAAQPLLPVPDRPPGLQPRPRRFERGEPGRPLPSG